MDPTDSRLAALAEWLGIPTKIVSSESTGEQLIESLDRAASGEPACVLVNPSVVSASLNSGRLPERFVSTLVERFPRFIVHAPRPEPFDCALVNELSCGHLHSVVNTGSGEASYQVSSGAEDVCGPFAGLSFRSGEAAGNRVFSAGSQSSTARDLILLDGRPFMALVTRGKTQVLFLANRDVADLAGVVGQDGLIDHFSRLAAPVMALRHIFGEECWRPRVEQACVIVDDPLLRSSYGFLKFDVLLRLMDEHHFHTSIAFIPHNFRRSSSVVVRMFKERPDRFSLCFHGNDHTDAEFASTDPALLDAILDTAERRVSGFHRYTGLDCDHVMVFPQGKFSRQAMVALAAHGFDAAVNTGFRPAQEPEAPLKVVDLMQPAVLRYGSFPLFLRSCSSKTDTVQIAFKLFFGQPVFMVEHHDTFGRPEVLIEAVERINSIAPQVQWVSPGTAIRNALLWRRGLKAEFLIRAYSHTARISNDWGTPARFRIEWNWNGERQTGNRESATVVDLDLEVGGAMMVSKMHKRRLGAAHRLGVGRTVKGLVRRRLSELRDNYICKNPSLLAAAVALKKRLLRS